MGTADFLEGSPVNLYNLRQWWQNLFFERVPASPWQSCVTSPHLDEFLWQGRYCHRQQVLVEKKGLLDSQDYILLLNIVLPFSAPGILLKEYQVSSLFLI